MFEYIWIEMLLHRVIAHANTNFANKQMKFFFSCSSNTVIDSNPLPFPVKCNTMHPH